MNTDSEDEGVRRRHDMDMRAFSSSMSVEGMSGEEVAKLHRQKLMALMRSNSKLQAEIKQLRKEQSDNYRVKQLKNLRQQLRETQAIADELTRRLISKGGMNEDEVGELFDEVLSQPKLAKPNNPVRLRKDLVILQQKHEALERELAEMKRTVREYRTGLRRPDEDGTSPLSPSRSPASPSSSSSAPDSSTIVALKEQVRQLRLELDLARGESESQSRLASVHRELAAKTQDENRELRASLLRLESAEISRKQSMQDARASRDALVRSVSSTEETAQDVRELRMKLSQLISVRDQVEQSHATKVAQLTNQLSKLSDRETALLNQLSMLQSDLKSMTNAVTFYRNKLKDARHDTQVASESERILERETKIEILRRENREKKTQIKLLQAQLAAANNASTASATGGGRRSNQAVAESESEAIAALRQQLDQALADNARLHQAMERVERNFIVHHESQQLGEHRAKELEKKVHSLLSELDAKSTRFEQGQTLLQELQSKYSGAQVALASCNDQVDQLRSELDTLRRAKERAEMKVVELERTLAERSGFERAAAAINANGESAPALAASSREQASSSTAAAAGSMSARSDSSSSSLLTPRTRLMTGTHLSASSTASLRQQLQEQEDRHLEHVAKLLKNFDQKEKQLLHQIAILQEQRRPGSANPQHLRWRPTTTTTNTNPSASTGVGRSGKVHVPTLKLPVSDSSSSSSLAMKQQLTLTDSDDDDDGDDDSDSFL